MGILQIQLFFIDVRHAENIKILVHGEVADLLFNQRQNSSADKRIIVYFPNAVKQERMMRDEKIRLCIDGLPDRFLCSIQSDQDTAHFTVAPSHQETRIIPFFRAVQWILFFQLF